MPVIKNEKGQFVRQYVYERNCLVCGKEFSNKQIKVKTCSVECGHRKVKELNPKKRVVKECVSCNKIFSIPESWIRKGNTTGTYCSKECRYGRKMKWSEKDKWSARNFTQKMLREGVLKRNPCEICGEFAQAHHLKGYDKENWLSIQWLCKKHHLQEHERLRMNALEGFV